MFRLFKYHDGKHYYWQAWGLNEKTGIVQWGLVGQSCHSKKLKSGFFKSYQKKINTELNAKIVEGFKLIDKIEMKNLGLKLLISEDSLSETMKIRSSIKQQLQDYLKNFGIGHIDYVNPHNSDTTICCQVVDLAIAKKAIGEFIAQSEYKDQMLVFEL